MYPTVYVIFYGKKLLFYWLADENIHIYDCKLQIGCKYLNIE